MALLEDISDFLRPREPQGDPNLPRYGNAGFKRNGFLGTVPVKGGYATEYSIGDESGEMPSMVSTLDTGELQQLVGAINDKNAPFPKSVADKARRHAAIRRAVGLSPFAGDNESPVQTRHPGPWKDEYVMPDPAAGRLNALLASFRRPR